MVMNNWLAFLIHLVTTRHRRAKQLSDGVIIPSVGPSSSPAPQGLQAAEAKAKAGGIIDEGESCCICLLRFGEEHESVSEISRLPCSHMFHKGCVDRWLSLGHRTCPVCRFALNGDKASMKKEHLTEEMVIWFSSFHVAGF